jgi:hypothetical protein
MVACGVAAGTVELATATDGTLGEGAGGGFPSAAPSANATIPTIARLTTNSGTGVRRGPPTLCSSTSLTGTVSVPTSGT